MPITIATQSSDVQSVINLFNTLQTEVKAAQATATVAAGYLANGYKSLPAAEVAAVIGNTAAVEQAQAYIAAVQAIK